MRLQLGCPEQLNETTEFAEWILKNGDGAINEPNDGETNIRIPDEILIKDSFDPVASIANFAYPSIAENICNPNYFQERAILIPTNDEVDMINDRLLSMIPGEEKIYLSSDNVCETEQSTHTNKLLYTPDVLNGLKLSGVPNHKLTLKVGIPIMLLRNIDQRYGLCNGTRLQVVRLGQHVNEGRIISGSHFGNVTLIPRMCLSPSDRKTPVKINRRQFPILVSFAMTINKSQGQFLSRVGLYLPRSVFTHGQLYVALSRVKSKEGLRLLIYDNNGKTMTETTNVEYKEVLQNL